MRRTTTTGLALAGAALAAPAAALAVDRASPLGGPLAGQVTVASQMQAARHENLRDDLTTRAVRQARRTATARDRDFSGRAERRRLRGASADELRDRIRELRRERRELRRREARRAAAPAVPPVLEAIAACESGGDPTAIGGGGLYRGKYQFSYSTWQSVGGTGDPAAAPEAEQDRRAAMLYAREGAAPWPVCGR